MTAREQLKQAAEDFRDSDRNVVQKGAGAFTNSARKAAYHSWIAALYRFRHESVKGRPK